MGLRGLFGRGNSAHEEDSATLYVGRLESGTSVADLYRLFATFRKQWQGATVYKKALAGGETAYWGVVKLCSKKAAQKAIKALDGGRLDGFALKVRLFETRSAHNERRSPNWRTMPWDGPERRSRDRRCYEPRQAPVDDLFGEVEVHEEETVDLDNIRVEGYRNFSRKGG